MTTLPPVLPPHITMYHYVVVVGQQRSSRARRDLGFRVHPGRDTLNRGYVVGAHAPDGKRLYYPWGCTTRLTPFFCSLVLEDYGDSLWCGRALLLEGGDGLRANARCRRGTALLPPEAASSFGGGLMARTSPVPQSARRNLDEGAVGGVWRGSVRLYNVRLHHRALLLSMRHFIAPAPRRTILPTCDSARFPSNIAFSAQTTDPDTLVCQRLGPPGD
ncbi:hypothetical protein FB451DRAFT_1403337 [Mycena latifolia]|nr:hypothetical protein FB451DRAFT_1403337 [Mycena latifolia]